MTYPYGTPTTIVRRVKSSTPDAFGNDVFTEVREDVTAQAFSSGTSTEQTQGRDTIIARPRVSYPPGTDLSGLDAVIVDGVQYEVEGRPRAPMSPFTGWQPGVVVNLKGETG